MYMNEIDKKRLDSRLLRVAWLDSARRVRLNNLVRIYFIYEHYDVAIEIFCYITWAYSKWNICTVIGEKWSHLFYFEYLTLSVYRITH